MGKNTMLVDQIDTLKEAGNIGAGNAATALSLLLSKPIDMSIAQVNVKYIQEIGQVLGNEENYIAAMLIEVYGDMKGMLVLTFEVESALAVVNTILSTRDSKNLEFDELDYSVLCETGNILAGHYLNALGKLTGLELTYSVPQMAMDMASAILSYPASTYATDDNAMTLIETAFTDNEKMLNGTYFLVLNQEGADTIIQSLERLL